MDIFNRLWAEQTPVVQINVVKLKSELTQFQTAVQPIYNYAYENAARMSEVGAANYSIISLPDTVAYLPSNSIFENIILYNDDFPDFRFVKVAPSNISTQVQLKPITVNEKQVETLKTLPLAKQPMVTTEVPNTIADIIKQNRIREREKAVQYLKNNPDSQEQFFSRSAISNQDIAPQINALDLILNDDELQAPVSNVDNIPSSSMPTQEAALSQQLFNQQQDLNLRMNNNAGAGAAQAQGQGGIVDRIAANQEQATQQ